MSDVLADIPGHVNKLCSMSCQSDRGSWGISPASPCHGWLKYTKLARRPSLRKPTLQWEWDFSPQFCTLFSKSWKQGRWAWCCGHGAVAMASPPQRTSTAGKIHAPVPLPCLLCHAVAIHWEVTRPSNFKSSCECWCPHKDTVSPSSHLILCYCIMANVHSCCQLLEHQGQPWLDQHGRLPVSKPVPFLHPASICSNNTTTAAKFRVASCRVGGGEGGLLFLLSAQLLEQTLKVFPAVCEFNVWKDLPQLCPMLRICP